MDIRKKAIAAAVLLACAAPLSVSMDFAAPATAYATPATETQASDAFAVDFKKGQPPSSSRLTVGRTAIPSTYSGTRTTSPSKMERCS
jgi:hypothetical protein